jgi:type I restriction enzyme M protein
MQTKELEAYLWGAANILRGLIDAADFKQYIFPLLFFKRISDVWDEEYQQALADSKGDLTYAEFGEQHRFQIPKGCHWEDVRKKTLDVGGALQKALNGIEKANFEMLHDVFGDAQWTNKRRMSDEKMLDLIEHFSKIKMTVAEVPHDIMGDGYEYLIKKFADDSGHTAAEFYTNRTVVKLMTMITRSSAGRKRLRPHLRKRRHFAQQRVACKRTRQRIPYAQTVRTGVESDYFRHRSYKYVHAQCR